MSLVFWILIDLSFLVLRVGFFFGLNKYDLSFCYLLLKDFWLVLVVWLVLDRDFFIYIGLKLVIFFLLKIILVFSEGGRFVIFRS